MRGSASTTVTFASQLGEGGAELQPDIAAADHHQLLRHLVQRQRLGGRDHRAAERQERQLDRRRAGGDHDGLGADRLHAGLGLHLDRLAVAKRRPAMHGLHPGLLEQAGDAVGQPPDDGVLPGDGALEVERGIGERDAERRLAGRHVDDLLELVGGVDQRLGRDAADGEAGAAGLLRLDDHGVDAELAGADGADIAARTGADDEQLAGNFLHQLNLLLGP